MGGALFGIVCALAFLAFWTKLESVQKDRKVKLLREMNEAQHDKMLSVSEALLKQENVWIK